ncbi:MAG: hypothetical protein JWN38_439 [Candidatus Saccharibacteria bacterium]|nr:hypothetical protein [Candidatus Saccharibacteria bacterium]
MLAQSQTLPPEVAAGEYRLGSQMVVFSHGFGVDRYGNELLSDLAQAMPAGYGYVLFDYNQKADDGSILVSTFAQQQAILDRVIAWAGQQSGVTAVHLVAHSMGCIIAALLAPTAIKNCIFLAPPLSIGENVRQYFTSKVGAQKDGPIWVVPRRRGAVTRMPEKIFDEMEATDAGAVLSRFGTARPYLLALAGADELLAGQDYRIFADTKVELVGIDDANHDFSDHARQQLCTLVAERLAAS